MLDYLFPVPCDVAHFAVVVEGPLGFWRNFGVYLVDFLICVGRIDHKLQLRFKITDIGHVVTPIVDHHSFENIFHFFTITLLVQAFLQKKVLRH